MADPALNRAADRVSLACQALSAAASELRVALDREPTAVTESTANALDAEVERVCELANRLARRAERLTFAGSRG